LALGAPLMITACATVGPPQPPSLELPKPPSDLRAVRKGDHVTLTWTLPAKTTDRQTVRSLGPTRICRGLAPELTECGTPVGQAAAQAIPRPSPSSNQKSKEKISGTYTDTLPASFQSDNPSGLITYAIEVLNSDGRGAGLSNLTRVSLVQTLPPPRDLVAKVTSQGVVLTWGNDLSSTASTSPVHYLYRIYRRQEGSQQRTLVGEIATGGESLTLTDANVEWEKTYFYSVTIVTICADEVKLEGDDSPEVKVFADDVFPPAVPSGLQAVFSGPGQQAFIDLIWAPVTDLDLDGYNVYRHEEGMAAVKMNAALVKTPAYRDTAVVSGKSYFYSVSAVDLRGNESARSEEASEAAP